MGVAEFHNEAQRASYLDALEHEAEGYESRIASAKADGDTKLEKRYKGRLAQVIEEATRVVGLGHTVEETVAEEDDDKDEKDGGGGDGQVAGDPGQS